MTTTAVATVVAAGTLLLPLLVFAITLTIVLILSDTLQSLHMLVQIYQAITMLQTLV